MLNIRQLSKVAEKNDLTASEFFRLPPLNYTPAVSVSQIESTLKHKDIVGVTAVGRQEIGSTTVVLWGRSDQKERRAMIQSEVRRAEETTRQSRAVEMGVQTVWNTTDRKLTLGDTWKYEPLRFSLILRSFYNLLPSPTNAGGDSQRIPNVAFVTDQAHWSMFCLHVRHVSPEHDGYPQYCSDHPTTRYCSLVQDSEEAHCH